jgi:phosphoglycerate dehydrogenase-like enzyme
MRVAKNGGARKSRPAGHPRPGLDHTVLAPHTGYLTREAYRAGFVEVVENIDWYLGGDIPERCLNKERQP